MPNEALAAVGALTTPDEIRAARIALGLTQEAFAAALGYKADSVRAWEATPQRRPVQEPARIILRLMLGLQRPPKLTSGTA